MSLLLHLSDLHLGNAGDDDVGDYSKTETVAETDRVTRRKLIMATLRGLRKWLAENDDSLDAVIVTGDITTRGRPSGFDELPTLLDALGNKLPPPDRIIVVPGNHDVSWCTEPGSQERYQHFIDGVRARGYRTPLLDGIDYDGDVASGKIDPVFVGDDFIVVAVNSADMCGVIEPLPPKLEELVASLERDRHLAPDDADLFRRHQIYDMPRIQPRQLDALNDFVTNAVADGRPRVRLAAIHHQLMPVREEEEVKPYESIVNLAAFTGFLADAEVDVIVHGHKHADHVRRLSLTADAHPRTAVVSACGTIDSQMGAGHEVAKLIRIGSSLPTLRTVEIFTVPALNAGQTVLRDKIKSLYYAPTWRPPAATKVTVVDGTTSTDIQEQLRALADRPERPRRDLICVIDNGATALAPPESYPWPANTEVPLADWFADTVEWWQDPAAAVGKPFTHGQRLCAWATPAGLPVDQLSRIKSVLAADPSTSRGVAVLVDPSTDVLEDKKRVFPSFSLLHLWIDLDRLHCSAYFRKQEMNYWWAVNAAEIAHVQKQVLDDLRATHADLKPGSIRTHAGEPVYSNTLPSVDVPRVDRRFWKNPESVRVLAVAIADEKAPRRGEDLADLLALLDDWDPEDLTPPADGAPVPGPGLAAIADTLTELAARYPNSQAMAAATALRDIHEANDRYLANRDQPDATSAYKAWRSRVRPKIQQLRTLVDPPRSSGRQSRRN